MQADVTEPVSYLVDAATLRATLGYLGTQPYTEVFQLIAAVQKSHPLHAEDVGRLRQTPDADPSNAPEPEVSQHEPAPSA